MTFAAPTAFCLLPHPIMATAGALVVLLGDVLARRDWPRAVLEAVVTAFALAVAAPFVTAAGLPSSTPDPVQVVALLGISVMINIVTGRSMRSALASDALVGAGEGVAFAVLALEAAETGQILWGLLALVPVGTHLLGAGVVVTREKALRTAERLLGLPHLMAPWRTTGADLVPFTRELRHTLGSDVLLLRIRLPGGGAWVEASADAVTYHSEQPEKYAILKVPPPMAPTRHIPRNGLPAGWRAGVHVPIHAPDARNVGCLVLGWTRWRGRYLAAWMTTGVLGGAVTSTARALGAFWAESHAATQLEAERSRLSAVVDHSDVAVLALNEEGWIVIWNMAMANLVGMDADAALDRRPEELFTLTAEDGTAVPLASGLRGSVRLTTRGGRSLWLQVSCSAPPEVMAPGLLAAVFVDESAERQVESMRHQLMMSLHHELHGPLTAIRAHGQLLQEVLPEDEDMTDSLGAIQDSVEIMHHVIDDLVHVVGPDPSAQPATTMRRVEVEPLLRRTLRNIPSVARRAVIAAPSGLTVHGDPVRLRQCLLLVFGNAEKYAPEGKIDIGVRLEDAHVVISVADHGPGIPSRDHDRVREPYYRSVTTRDQPGSGMGLYIVDTLMAAMSGRMTVTSAPSGGLEVRFHLPLSSGPDGEDGAL